ncbi:hypothetical protein A3Q56_04000, partial [Intoshia linei]
TRNVICSVISYCFISLLIIPLDTIIFTWLSTSIYKGGLHLNSKELSNHLIAAYILPPILIILYSSKFIKKYNITELYCLMCWLVILTTMWLPLIQILVKTKLWMKFVLIIMLTINKIGKNFIFLLITLIINNSVSIDKVGKLNGILYGLCSLISVIWGYLFDKFNTRLLLMITFLLTGLCTFFYGFGGSIYYLVLFKMLLGLSSGSVIISKSAIRLYSSPENESFYATAFTVGMAIGLVLSSSITGYITNPLKYYNMDPEKYVFFKNYPYSLPGMFCSFLCILAIIMSFLMMPKHKPKNTRNIICSIASYCFISFAIIPQDSILFSWLSTSVYQGGLHLDTREISKYLSATYFLPPIILILVSTRLLYKIDITFVIFLNCDEK